MLSVKLPPKLIASFHWLEGQNTRKTNLLLEGENEQGKMSRMFWCPGEEQWQKGKRPFITLPCFLSCQGTLRASSRLHDDLFRRILRSPMKFFDTTPTGRILNRFSKDMDEGISHCMCCRSRIQTLQFRLSSLLLLG